MSLNKNVFKETIINYLNQDEIEVKELARLLNKFLEEDKQSDKLRITSSFKNKIRILICTGAGNIIQGGADIWVNHFLNLVWPLLPDKKNWRLLIDSKRPSQFDPKSLPKGLMYHFHFDDVEKTDKWLHECEEIHSLHSHYHKRPHIWHYEDKFKTIFVHAYPREMEDVVNKIEELKRLQLNTKVDAEWYDDYLLTFRKRIWIGNNYSSVFDNFPNYTYNIPNFYEFKNNISVTTHTENGKVGFASRVESRKCIHWMNELEGYALTSQIDVKNLRDTTSYTLPKINLFQWDPTIHHQFMLKNWGIFHGAYFKEPFGYSIFQAVDYGKVPIINKDWAVEVEYDYRASTMNEFKKIAKKIQFDPVEKIQKNFNNLKEYMMKFDNKEVWIDKIRTTLLT